jgi:hypothetical protein
VSLPRPVIRAWPFVVVAVTGLVPVFALMFAGWSTGGAPPASALPMVIVALLLYLGSHGVRLLRALIVAGPTAPSVRSLAMAHASTAAWGALLPFKTGELVRVIAMGVAMGGWWRGLRIVIVERTLDAVVLGGSALLAMMLLPEASDQGTGILGVSLGVIIAVALLVWVLPEQLVLLKHWIVRRYSAPWSLRALAAVDRILEALRGVRALVEGRLATLWVLTIVIWGMEVAVLALLLKGMGASARTWAVAVASMLEGLWGQGPWSLMPTMEGRGWVLLGSFVVLAGFTLAVALGRSALIRKNL